MKRTSDDLLPDYSRAPSEHFHKNARCTVPSGMSSDRRSILGRGVYFHRFFLVSLARSERDGEQVPGERVFCV